MSPFFVRTIGVIALLLFCGAAETPTEKKSIPPANHFTIGNPGTAWLNVSRPILPEDLRDKIILLDFWTYCCVNCIQTLPEIAKVEKEFKDDLVVIGVHSAKFDNEKDTDLIRQAVLRYGVEHPVVNDHDFRIWRAFEVRAWPTLVLLRPNGEIESRYSGEGHIDEIRKAVRNVRKAFPKKAPNKLPILLERDKAAKGEFFFPSKLAFDEKTKTLFVADSSHHQIAAYEWDAKSPAQLKPRFRVGKSGSGGFADGTFSSARFRRPQGLLVGKDALYVADTENHRIRKIDLKSKMVTTIAGNGARGSALDRNKSFSARSTGIASPWDLTFHPDENQIVIASAGMHQLLGLDLKTGKVSVIAGHGAEAIDDGLFEEKNNLAQPSGLSSLLGSLYFVDSESSSLRFYFDGYVRTLVGSGLFDFGFKDGDRKKAKLQHPLALDAEVTGVYIADTYNHAIRRYDPAKQTMETVVGDGQAGMGGETAPEPATKARLNEPSGITRLNDDFFVIADTNNQRLVVWNRTSATLERMKIEGEKPTTAPSATPVPVSAATSTEAKLEPKVPEGKAFEGRVAAPKRISLRLPNTLPFPEAKVNRTSTEIRVILPENFKLNADGPSFARLFAGAPPKETVLKEWKREDLQNSLVLSVSGLKEGTPYLFQGTFYFCMDSKNAICEIASASFPITVDPAGSEKVDVLITSGVGKEGACGIAIDGPRLALAGRSG